MFIGGECLPWDNHDEVTSPIIDSKTGKRTVIGTIARLTIKQSELAVEYAEKAWNGGQGEWPQMTPNQRIAAINQCINGLKERRSEIVNTLMWEICKTAADAATEFDRTMLFIENTLQAYKSIDKEGMGEWKAVGGVIAKVRRAGVGIMMAVGPYNYPFNET